MLHLCIEMPSASNASRLGSRALLERGGRLVGDCQLILRADEHQLSRRR